MPSSMNNGKMSFPSRTSRTATTYSFLAISICLGQHISSMPALQREILIYDSSDWRSVQGREQRRRLEEEPMGLRETMEVLTSLVLLHFRTHFRNLRNKHQKLPKWDFEIMFGARKSMERCCWPRQGRPALVNLAVDILKERADGYKQHGARYSQD
jgi:hypothetical protein